MIPGLTLILCFQLLGEIATRGLGLPMPGPVAGLILLLSGCCLSRRLGDVIRPVARGILGHLSLFFVPAGVGIIAHWPILSRHGPGLAVVLIVSTVLAIAVAALSFAAVQRLTGKAGHDA
ncbi:MAG: CidA/LrgA family protein [Paracoccus sp. (in: a-proteobacteria)]|nr:CidA/LrgA family protein [Paracoccus sp. (in: a-proteobacteria)]